MNTSSNTPSGLPMTTLSRRSFIIGPISSVVGCTSMGVQQVLDSPEKTLQKKFG